MFEILRKRAQADLARERPELLIVEVKREPFPDWIVKDYELLPMTHEESAFAFYMRRGGRLARQFYVKSVGQ